jgi:hypothetical protein
MGDADTDTDVSELARAVVAELDPGTVIDDKLILSRRQAIALASGTLGLGALGGFATDGAAAQQAAGQVGTSSDPVDVEANTITAANSITENGNDVVSSPDSDYEIQKNGTDGSGVINFKTE